jgi:signal transduction histidine kinase
MGCKSAKRAILAAGVAVAVSLCTPAHSQETVRAKTVIALHGAEAANPTDAALDKALREALRGPATEQVQFFSEYIDSARFEGPEQDGRLATFLAERYAGKTIDVIFATGPVALRFLLKYRDEISRGTPVVFMDARKASVDALALPPDFVGRTTEIEGEPVVRLALQLRPASREVVIVTGTADFDKAWQARLRSAAAKVAPNLPVRVLSDLAIEDVERELAALTPDSVVVGGPFRRDGKGRFFSGATQLMEHLSAVSGAPLFHMSWLTVGRGAVGVAAVPPEANARQAAAIAKSILAGSPPAAVALPEAVSQQRYVDWRQLRRWKIDEDLVPPDAVVLFREASFWSQYRNHVLIVASVFLIQTALIAALLLEARRRKRAEVEAHVQRETLAHLSRVATLGAISVSIAHELNQPLGAILSNAQAARLFLDKDPAPLDEVREGLDAVIRNDQRAGEIVQSLRRMLLKGEVPKQRVGIEAILRELLKLLDSELVVREAAVQLRLADEMPLVMANRSQLLQVLINLVINACDAMGPCAPSDRLVIIRTERTESGLRISVEDHGDGVPQALLDGKFEPFMTSKSQGLGLGLSICSSIVQSHGSRLRVRNKESGGAIFTFDLPAASKRQAIDSERQAA